MKTITQIGYKDENDNPQTATVGQYVNKITVHPAQGEGDKFFYEIYLTSGDVITVFNPIRVVTKEL